MSRNSKNNRKRRAKKKAQYEKRRQVTGCTSASSAAANCCDFDASCCDNDVGASAADYFGNDAVVTVNVLRSASGKHYAEHELIPLDDREVLEAIEHVPVDQVDELAAELRKKIAEGEYPSDAHVTSMGQPTFHPF